MPLSRVKSVFRARASLIDRLVDDQPAVRRESRPLRTLTRKQLKAVVMRDLGWLLNTRTSGKPSRFDSEELTVIDYGMPDFGAYFTANPEDRERLIQRMIRAISAFEPRLQKVRIAVEPIKINEKKLKILIEAVIVVHTVRAPVSFLTVFHDKTGTMEIYENR
jgi:type VI secretion system protein ImpF